MKTKGLPAKSLWVILAMTLLILIAVVTAVKLSSSGSVAPNVGSQASASSCEEIIKSIKGIPTDKRGAPDQIVLQKVLMNLCSQRPDCMYSAEKKNCVTNTKCGNLNQACCSINSRVGEKPDPRGIYNKTYCTPGLFCSKGICIKSNPTPTPTRFPTPTPSVNPVNCGISSFSPFKLCPGTRDSYMSANYVCLNGQKGVAETGRCTPISELKMMAERFCTSSCNRPTPTPTRYPTPTPTPYVTKYPTPTPTSMPTPIVSQYPTPTPFR